jgi:hypothetical protein
MDNVVMALCVFIILFYTQFFFVKQLGLGLGSEKEKNSPRVVLKKLAFGTARPPKAKSLLSSTKMTHPGKM